MEPKIKIPKPIQIVIDDVGWWCGDDGHQINQPFRTGIFRDHVIEDYNAIFKLGKDLDVRPQAAFVLCQWDRENILRELPDSTWMGKNWDNSNVSVDTLEQAADLLNANRKFFEFTLHGIGHEFWQNGRMVRAEWYDGKGKLRPSVKKHLDYYAKLMEMNSLGKFPISYVPCAFYYHYGSTTDSLAKILFEYGIKFVSSPFEHMVFSRKPETDLFGFDHGLITINRGKDIKKWNDLGGHPEDDYELQHPIVGMHWPQLLHKNPSRNYEIANRWIAFLMRHDRMLQWTLAKDMKSFSTQLLHSSLSEISICSNFAIIDFSKCKALGWPEFSNNLIIKFSSEKPLKFSSTDAHIVSCKKNDDDIICQYTLSLKVNNINSGIIKIRWEVDEF